MKKYRLLLLIIPLIIFTVIGILSRKTLNNFISIKMKEQTSAADSLTVAQLITTNYNYSKNELDYDFTLLEFGSTGCSICKQMEPVLEEFRKLEKPKVNVVFLNIMHPENLAMMKYFGISAVPMQIMLDKAGNEFFRHYGFISTADLTAKATIQQRN